MEHAKGQEPLSAFLTLDVGAADLEADLAVWCERCAGINTQHATDSFRIQLRHIDGRHVKVIDRFVEESVAINHARVGEVIGTNKDHHVINQSTERRAASV